MGCSKSSSRSKVYSDTGLPQETRKISNNLTFHVRELEKEEKTKPNISRRNKIREEINKIETKKTEKINENKSWFLEKIKLTNLQAGSSRRKERGTRNKPNIYGQLTMTKEAKNFSGEKTVSSISGAGKTRQLHVKE